MNQINPFKFIFMYNNFDNMDDDLFCYIESFFRGSVMIRNSTYYDGVKHDHGTSLWVAEDVYNYVYAAINTYNLFVGDIDPVTVDDCEEWKQHAIEYGLVEEVL